MAIKISLAWDSPLSQIKVRDELLQIQEPLHGVVPLPLRTGYPNEKMVYLFFRQLQNTTKGEMVEKFRAMVYQAIQD